MTHVVFLLIVWVPFFAAGALRAHHARMLSGVRPRSVPAMPEALGETGEAKETLSAWSALDDRQLTRLLTDSVPPTATE